MKCVQDESGKIKRVSDLEAMRLVFSGQWRYVPKHLWKAQRERAGGMKES